MNSFRAQKQAQLKSQKAALQNIKLEYGERLARVADLKIDEEVD